MYILDAERRRYVAIFNKLLLATLVSVYASATA